MRAVRSGAEVEVEQHDPGRESAGLGQDAADGRLCAGVGVNALTAEGSDQGRPHQLMVVDDQQRPRARLVGWRGRVTVRCPRRRARGRADRRRSLLDRFRVGRRPGQLDDDRAALGARTRQHLQGAAGPGEQLAAEVETEPLAGAAGIAHTAVQHYPLQAPRDAGAVVGDLDHNARSGRPGAHPDSGTGSVPSAVAEQVGDHLREHVAPPGGAQPGPAVQLDDGSVGAPQHDRIGEDGRDVEGRLLGRAIGGRRLAFHHRGQPVELAQRRSPQRGRHGFCTVRAEQAGDPSQPGEPVAELVVALGRGLPGPLQVGRRDPQLFLQLTVRGANGQHPAAHEAHAADQHDQHTGQPDCTEGGLRVLGLGAVGPAVQVRSGHHQHAERHPPDRRMAAEQPVGDKPAAGEHPAEGQRTTQKCGPAEQGGDRHREHGRGLTRGDHQRRSGTRAEPRRPLPDLGWGAGGDGEQGEDRHEGGQSAGDGGRRDVRHDLRPQGAARHDDEGVQGERSTDPARPHVARQPSRDVPEQGRGGAQPHGAQNEQILQFVGRADCRAARPAAPDR